MSELRFAAPPQVVLPVVDGGPGFPVHRVYCVGRNYAEHVREMGNDPAKSAPFFFLKNPDDLALDGRMPYPALTADLHHEVELAVLLGRGGRDIAEAEAMAHVFGYAVALDMTRRDLQAEAKAGGRPWAAAKAFELSAPIGAVVPAAAAGAIDAAAITLSVNGAPRQAGRIAEMIWPVPAIIAALSQRFVLAPGDVILTGTPAGVGPVVRGDVIEGRIDGLPPLSVTIV